MLRKLQRTFFYSVAMLVCLLAAGRTAIGETNPKPYFFDQAVVLAIGIDDYRYVREVKYAENDAREVGKTLRERYGFTPDYLLGADATKDAILEKIDNYSERIGENDVFILFFAGHGQVVEISEPGQPATREGFLIPHDAQLLLSDHRNTTAWRREAIDMRKLVEQVIGMEAKHVLILADACCSGFMTQRGSNLRARHDLQFLLNHGSRAVIAATTANQQATWDDEQKHGYFSKALIDELDYGAKRRKAASVLDLFERVRFLVSKETKASMVPVLNANLSDEPGELVFVPKSISQADVDQVTRLAARENSDEGRGKPHILSDVLEKARERANVRTTERQVIEAYEALDYRFSSEPAVKEQYWRSHFERASLNAPTGDVFAMALLHYCYSKGLGTEKDLNAAYRWAREAYDSGMPAGKHVLGRCYLNGIGIEKNEKAAWRLIQEAADRGFAISCSTMAFPSLAKPPEKLTKADVRKGRDWLEKAAQGGVHGAKVELAILALGQKPGTKYDGDRIMKLLNEAADKGCEHAIFSLADIYSTGLPGIDRDKEKGRELIEKAANAGFADAQHNLACEYLQAFSNESRLGYEKNPEEAIEWYELAASQGYVKSMYRLLQVFMGQLGVPADHDKARQYCDMAIKHGFTRAMAVKAHWYIMGELLEQDFGTGMKLAQQAANQGDPLACRVLAAGFLDGIGLDGNRRAPALYFQLRHHALHWSMKGDQWGGDEQCQKNLRKFAKDLSREEFLRNQGIPLGNPIGGDESDVLERWEKEYPDTAKAFKKKYLPKQS